MNVAMITMIAMTMVALDAVKLIVEDVMIMAMSLIAPHVAQDVMALAAHLVAAV